MKKIFYLYAVVLGAIVVGCNPLDDIYNDLDGSQKPIVGDEVLTLSDDDYEELGLTYGSFNSVEDAKTMLPALLEDKYPPLGLGSSALVNYNLYVGNAEGVGDYANADIYELTNDDYASTGSDAYGFYPNVNADDYIPGILDAAIATPTEDQIVLAKYDQYFSDPVVGLAPVYSAAFPTDFGAFEIRDELGGDDVWGEGSAYVQGSGYNGFTSANIEWFISPEIDLAGQSDLKFQINQYMKYVNGEWDYLKILVSTDYTTGGDHLTATWSEIEIATLPAGDGDEFVLSEDYDFSAYDGEKIHVGFRLESDVSTAARWRIESFAIKTLGVDGDANNKGTHYAYSGGEWEAVDGVYFLSSADFDSMGTGSGQPGQYNNFGSSTPPGDYLPTFLSLNEPWAYGQEEDEMIMVYDYYSSSSGAQIRADRYTITDGIWLGHESTIMTSLQFGHDGTTWVPDNTIKYILQSDDYATIVDVLGSTYPDATASVGNYGNFDRRVGNPAEWTDPMMLDAMNAVLSDIDPGAAEGQKYVVTGDIYNGSNTTEDFAVIKTGDVWVYQE